MSSTIDRVATDDVLPRSTDVVVIGGGIIGVSAALTLAERGIAVVLIEKGAIAGEQSSRNWGWCRQQGRDPRELPLIIESLRLWRGLNQRIEGETGFRQCGVVYLARTAADLAAHKAWLRSCESIRGGFPSGESARTRSVIARKFCALCRSFVYAV